MKLKLSILALAAASIGIIQAQTSYTGTGSTGLWFSSRWNNSADTAPYTSAFTANNATSFAAGTYTFTGGGTGSVGNVTLADGASVTFSGQSGTWGTGGNVRTLTIGNGSILDLNGNAVSTTVGTGFIKNGSGVFGTGGGAFTGGFTINAGTVVARGTTGMGSGASNTLTLNGGTIASNANRDFASTRFGGGITIGGNVQFGELATVVSIASSTANLGFANNVSLGSATRTFTSGNNGTNTFSGIISGTSEAGLTIAAAAGTTGSFILSGGNTYGGATSISSGVLLVNGNNSGATGNVSVSSGATLGGNGTVGGATTISGTHAPGSAAATVGTQTFSSSVTYSTSSIFSWDLNAVSTDPGAATVNSGPYDKVVATGAITGSSAVFNVVLGSGKAFTDAFWNTSKSWNDIFTASSAPNLATIFTSIGGTGITNGVVADQGTFAFAGSSLTWTPVPEPSSALAGLLLGAGLLRRNRSQRV